MIQVNGNTEQLGGMQGVQTNRGHQDQPNSDSLLRPLVSMMLRKRLSAST
jgi:hypothetical protein